MSAVAVAFDQLEPMEATLTGELPNNGRWQFEPKWDGFRALVLRDGRRTAIKSRSGKPLDRYFPELVDALAHVDERCIFDGEIILPVGDVLSFDALQARLHPAASRIERLSRETPAQLMMFDLVWRGRENVQNSPLQYRRATLDAFHSDHGSSVLLLSPATRDVATAQAWLAQSGGALDGVVAKRLDDPYRPGERAMLKIKQLRTADCVVGGYRRTANGTGAASLLLGLFNERGLLDHVGFMSAFNDDDRKNLLAKLAPYEGGTGFTGKSPGGPSRWSRGTSHAFIPLDPSLVVEVVYDQVSACRFRHGTRFYRWRPEKAPQQCTFDQLIRELRPAELEALLPQEK